MAKVDLTDLLRQGILSQSDVRRISSGLTSKETDELNQLESEIKHWKHRKQLDKFRKLPANIRQEIVDEALLKDLLTDYEHNTIDETQFDNYERLAELRNKDNYNPWGNAKMGGHYHHGYSEERYQVHHWKYSAIHSQFKTDELLEAHSEATLEEELSN